MTNEENNDELESKEDILDFDSKMDMMDQMGFEDIEDSSLRVEDKIILSAFIHSLSEISKNGIDPAIVDSNNRLKMSIMRDLDGDFLKYKEIRNDLIKRIDNRYHIN